MIKREEAETAEALGPLLNMAMKFADHAVLYTKVVGGAKDGKVYYIVLGDKPSVRKMYKQMGEWLGEDKH